MRGNSQAQGFTYVELVIAMAIIALTLAFSGPYLQDYARNNRTKAATRSIYSLLQQAKITAIKQNKPIQADFTPAGEDGSLRGKLEIRDPGLDPTDPPLSFIDLSLSKELNGAKIVANGATSDVTFSGRGTVGTPNTVEVHHVEGDVNRYNVVINTAGGIRIEKQ
jgi:prepilin-type N-terminal cleavage/methylation domain-containing protein